MYVYDAGALSITDFFLTFSFTPVTPVALFLFTTSSGRYVDA